MRKHISRIVSAFVAVTMFLYCAPLGAVSAMGAEEIDDTLTLEQVSNVSTGYELVPDTTTEAKTLEDLNFRKYVTDQVTADGWTILGGSTNYYGEYDGFIKKMPGNECGTESITFSVMPENMYEQTIYFDWSVDQAFTGFGQFKLHFYHNDNEVITYDFTSTANPYGNIMSEEYKYIPSGNEETFKWSFEKVATGDWEDDAGRKFYLGNIYHSTYDYLSILLPETVDNGTFTVKRGTEVLSNGSSVMVGDELTFESVPNEGFGVLSGTKSGTKILEDSDFVEIDMTNEVSGEGWTALNEKTEYYGRHDGIYQEKIAKDFEGTKSASLEVDSTECHGIKFDWAVNQGFINYGKFILHFYHNDEEVITRDFTEKANPYSNILSETYYYTPSETGDSFRWEFERKKYTDWGDREGRKFYLGRIMLISNTYEPESPVFEKLKTVSISEYENGSVEIEDNNVFVDSLAVLTAKPDDGYVCSDITVTDENGNIVEVTELGNDQYSFIMPDSNVNVSATFISLNYYISTKDELISFIETANKAPKLNGFLEADIDMGGEEIAPIRPSSVIIYDGSSEITELGYLGEFDGQNHKISNYTVRVSSDEASAGLFGTVSGTVKNVIIDNAHYDNSGEFDGRFSALVGQLLTNGVIENCVVVNSTVEADARVAGAVAGCNFGGSINNCVSLNNTVTADSRIGNLVGDNGNGKKLVGTVTNSYSDKSVVGTTSKSLKGNTSNCRNNVTDIKQIAYLLNTQNGTTENSGIWSASSEYPIGADESNKAVYGIIEYKNGVVTNTYYVKGGATFTFDDKEYYTNVMFNNESISAENGVYSIIVPEQDSRIDISTVDCEIYNVNGDTPSATIFSLEGGNVTVVFAAYDANGKLLSFDVMENVNINEGENSCSPTEKFNGDGAGKITVMLWDNAQSMKPLCEAESVER